MGGDAEDKQGVFREDGRVVGGGGCSGKVEARESTAGREGGKTEND